ncbi:signal transduction histidine kinase [Caenispirillum salinarum AK4]|uniref:histidine kinase n=1 Tax=Caenispirillum salinarum AK4 TaxID=1238182 RepID=K9HLR3_9PROT|nr:sensor histidine kinase [Caenispirillum salinarum]EKV31278.1 signal transduction histidine kinase [Caenispirillum salinarum AK4]
MAQDVDWERLYRETRHRIGNTMQMLLSLLRLQMRQGGDSSQATLQRLEVRMSAAAAAYALARVVPDDAEGGRVVVDFNALIADMAEEARRQVEPDMAPSLKTRLEPVEVSLEDAIPLAIAAMEVLVNAVEHGGPPITVVLGPGPESGWSRLVVEDGGTGVPAANLRKDGIGLRISQSLMRQVQGRLVLDEGPVRLEWPND